MGVRCGEVFGGLPGEASESLSHGIGLHPECRSSSGECEMKPLVRIHRSSEIGDCQIGRGSRVWQYVVIFDGARIGEDCNICSHVLIESDVVVGNRVTVKCGVQLWDGMRIADDVFIGPNVTFTNDKHPRSRVYPDAFLATRVEKGASIGGGAVVLPGLVIGAGAMVGAGAVVVRDVSPGATVVGNPARQIGGEL